MLPKILNKSSILMPHQREKGALHGAEAKPDGLTGNAAGWSRSPACSVQASRGGLRTVGKHTIAVN